MAINVTPIPKLAGFAAPAFTLGTANTAGSATTAVASNSTLLAFDTTLPAPTGPAATGSAVTAPRRDHVHAGAVAATQVEMEAASSSTVFATAGRTQYHPGVGKAWIQVPANGVITPSAANSYNVASVTATGTGDRTIVIATDFDNTTYAAVAQLSEHRSALYGVMCHSHAAGSVSLEIYDENDTKSDQMVDVCMFGLQV
tara:strand:- start:677 stop:1276 length:600 start_codon:yes stop_codon:yes gene_type:complete